VGAHTFDLGAQYFTVRDQRFAVLVERAVQAGACAPWLGVIGALEEEAAQVHAVDTLVRYVGTPGMNAFAKFIALGLDVRSGCRVDAIRPIDEQLSLTGHAAPPGTTLGPQRAPEEVATDFGQFDFVMVCLPPRQAGSLIDELSPQLTAVTQQTELWPCFAVGVVPNEAAGSLSVPWDGIFVGRDETRRSPLAWLARDSSKPARPPGERWMLQASPEWSKASFALDLEEVQSVLVQEFARLLALPSLKPDHQLVHRWAFAQVPRPQHHGATLDVSARLGVAGDWLAGGRVEGAYLSGISLAEQLIAQL
jgi:predicted NAD/FAD-dependent oxidoreductase